MALGANLGEVMAAPATGLNPLLCSQEAARGTPITTGFSCSSCRAVPDPRNHFPGNSWQRPFPTKVFLSQSEKSTNTPIVSPSRLDGTHPSFPKLPHLVFLSILKRHCPPPACEYVIKGLELRCASVSTHTSLKPWHIWFPRKIRSLTSPLGPN